MKLLSAPPLAIVLAVVWLSVAQAGSGDVHVLPAAGAKPKHGLKVTIDMRWVDGNGYRPARITLAPATGTAANDRQVQVKLSFNGERKPQVSTLIDLPAGSAGVTKTIAVPQCSPYYSIQVSTIEGDRALDDLCAPGLSMTSGGVQWSEVRPTVVWFDSDVPSRVDRALMVQAFNINSTTAAKTYQLPDFRGVAACVSEPESAAGAPSTALSPVSDAELLAQLASNPRVELLPLSEVATSWLELSSIDLIFISADDLQKLKNTMPERYAALRAWVASGPILCVYNVGKKYSRLDELETLLQLPPLPGADSPYRGWEEPNPEQRLKPLWPNALSLMQNDEAPPPATAEVLQKRWAISAVPPFLQREAGMGLVVAMADANPFPGEYHTWAWMLNSAPQDRWKWLNRHGLSQNRMNNDFWNQLIAGVGTAPVLPFILITTLFAIFIGPVNYLFLRRRKRLYLLLVTVPVGAAIMTVGLFGYAAIIDGFGARARIRSVTIVDQRLGQTVSWSRQSYYASVAPSQGLVFPVESAVFPLLYEPMQRNGQLNVGGLIHWSDRQELRSGYIGSRAMSQFLVVNVANSDSKLLVESKAGTPTAVGNGLHAKLHYLVVSERSAEGASPPKLWLASDVAPGQPASLMAVDWPQAREQLREYYDAAPLAFPEGFDPNNHDNAYEWWFPDYRRWSRIDGFETEPDVSTSLLEQQLLAMTGKWDCPLGPGEYVAVCDRPDEVPLGLPRVREGASLHLIRGRW